MKIGVVQHNPTVGGFRREFKKNNFCYRKIQRKEVGFSGIWSWR